MGLLQNSPVLVPEQKRQCPSLSLREATDREQEAGPSEGQGRAGGRRAAQGAGRVEGGHSGPGARGRPGSSGPSVCARSGSGLGQEVSLPGTGGKHPGVRRPGISQTVQSNRVVIGPTGSSAPGARRPTHAATLPFASGRGSPGRGGHIRRGGLGCVGCLRPALLRSGLDTALQKAGTRQDGRLQGAQWGSGLLPPETSKDPKVEPQEVGQPPAPAETEPGSSPLAAGVAGGPRSQPSAPLPTTSPPAVMACYQLAWLRVMLPRPHFDPGTEGQALLWNAWSRQDPGADPDADARPAHRPSLIILPGGGARHEPQEPSKQSVSTSARICPLGSLCSDGWSGHRAEAPSNCPESSPGSGARPELLCLPPWAFLCKV